MNLGKHVEVKTVEGRQTSNGIGSFDESVNNLLAQGWKIMSAPILAYSDETGSYFIQQLYRDKVEAKEFESDFRMSVDFLTRVANATTGDELLELKTELDKNKSLRRRIIEFNKSL